MPNYLKRIEVKWKRYYKWALADYRWLFMFLLSRFKSIRNLSTLFLDQPHENPKKLSETSCLNNIKEDEISDLLKKDGLYVGINLPSKLIKQIHNYVNTAHCYGNRDRLLPFLHTEKEIAEKKYEQTFIIGDYLDAHKDCEAIRQLQGDPKLLEIATQYLNTKPVHLSTKLWWSYATEASLTDRLNFAQVFFHYDLLDYRCLQFFFYLTNVDLSSGPHVCVRGSHQNKKLTHQFSFFTGRSDKNIVDYYGTDNLEVICGKAGLGFVEDPYCFHKGISPSKKNRLILKIVFSANSYRSGNL
ncbi:hypothetical protein [Pleurocapsa sp. PCC 7319]|uniref:hypothetical protein n=1 Tax=Pleurocapsa sp. PCC 7319 TaxID=118161 RepID=UPI000346724A|nr:hypothetical protein [Pleurocapsa sp. PCC 7319]